MMREKPALLKTSPHPPPAGPPALPEKLFSAGGEPAVPSVAKLRSRSRGGLPPRALRSVREFIEAHLEENISIQALAATAGLSMYHFARAFKQSEGVTPHHYPVRRRVRRGPDLLATPDPPLVGVRARVGIRGSKPLRPPIP